MRINGIVGYPVSSAAVRRIRHSFFVNISAGGRRCRMTSSFRDVFPNHSTTLFSPLMEEKCFESSQSCTRSAIKICGSTFTNILHSIPKSERMPRTPHHIKWKYSPGELPFVFGRSSLEHHSVFCFVNLHSHRKFTFTENEYMYMKLVQVTSATESGDCVLCHLSHAASLPLGVVCEYSGSNLMWMTQLTKTKQFVNHLVVKVNARA